MNNENSQWYLGRFRYQELRNFCLQYPEWRRELEQLKEPLKEGEDPTGETAVRLTYLEEHIQEVWDAASVTVGDDPQRMNDLIYVVTHRDPQDSEWQALGRGAPQLYMQFYWQLDKIRR